MYVKKNYVKRKRVYKKRNPKRSTKPTKVFAKKVQSVIDKNAENKISFGSQQNVYYNSSPNSTADCTGLCTNINYGTADNQRIGDQIRLKNHTVQGALQLSSPTTNINNIRIAVRLMVVQPRQFSNSDDAIAAGGNWLQYLIKKGGTTSAFTGTLSDLWAPINTDAIIKYYDKRFYLNTAYSQGTGNGISTMGDSIKFFNFKLGRKNMNKLLRYESSVGSSLTPTNYAPIIILGYVKLDGSAPDTVSTIVSLSYDTVMYFQDM